MIVRLRAIAYALFFYIVSTLIALTFGLVIWAFIPSRSMGFARDWSLLMVRAAEIILGIEVVVTGAEHIPATGAALIASQHRSAFDTMIWFRLVPQPSYVMKQELFRIPVFGWISKRTGMIGVDRAGGAAAMRAMIAAARHAAATRRQLIIFPEGTRVPAGHYVPPQPGIVALAMATGLPVIPVATDSGLVWGKGPFSKRTGKLHIAIGPAIPTGLRREALLQRLEAEWDALEREAGIASTAAPVA